MQPECENLAKGYDHDYLQPNYFGYKEWLYRPYIKGLVKKVGLKRGSSVLDVGCGQGFFTSLFADLGFAAVGVDISAEGIRAAQRKYGSSHACYLVGDIRSPDLTRQFDCVFTRSCSLFNSEAFGELQEVTDALLTHVRPGGIFIFDYYTKLSPRKTSRSWIYHSLATAETHFSKYAGAQVLFSLRFDSIALGSLAFTPWASKIAAVISQRTGIGGELLALIRKN